MQESGLVNFPTGLAILPELILAGLAILVIVLDLFIQRKGVLAVVSIGGIVLTGLASLMLKGLNLTFFSGMLVLDGFSIFFKLLFLLIAALVILASTDYVARFKRFQGEYYALVLLATLGMFLMAATGELISIYISLELASISLYALVGFLKDGRSTESSLKYMLLGAVASAVLLFGMALVFGFTGETRLMEISQALQGVSAAGLAANPGLMLGIVLMIAGFGFKIAAIPFHMWVPDVYEGAPTPVTAFLSVGSKAAGFAVIMRVFLIAFGPVTQLRLDWGMIFAVLAAVGMTVGNITAIPQNNIKRMLGYSSIAQAGYILVGLAAIGFTHPVDYSGWWAIFFFLTTYSLANLGAFSAIIAISNKVGSDQIDDYTGIGKRAPVLALGLTLCLLSLIGMPPAAGFMAKFYIFSTAVQEGLLWLVIIAVLNSVVSAYYYLRVVKVMWFGEPVSDEKVPSSGALQVALFISCLGVLLLFVLPGLLM
jgi:NADH-quinone oxidoreductase subunit N